MFERLTERIARVVSDRGEEKVREIESQLKAELPGGIGCEAIRGKVVISARGLGRRYVTDPELRALLARLR